MLYWLALTVGKAIEFWGSFAAGDRTENVEIAVLIFCIGFEDGCLGFIWGVAELISKVFLWKQVH